VSPDFRSQSNTIIIRSRRVTRALDSIIAQRGKPGRIRMDNGSEPRGVSSPGKSIGGSNSFTFSPENPRRTRKLPRRLRDKSIEYNLVSKPMGSTAQSPRLAPRVQPLRASQQLRDIERRRSLRKRFFFAVANPDTAPGIASQGSLRLAYARP